MNSASLDTLAAGFVIIRGGRGPAHRANGLCGATEDAADPARGLCAWYGDTRGPRGGATTKRARADLRQAGFARE
jgi:hypothetical protein